MQLNKSRSRTRSSADLALIILLLLVLGCSCQKFAEMLKNKSDQSPPPSTSNSTSPPSISDDRSNSGEYDLTMAKYNQIKIGTPRSDVERILGGKGTELSSSSGGGMSFSVNKWEGSDFKAVILSFKNDKVMTRSQVGLK